MRFSGQCPLQNVLLRTAPTTECAFPDRFCLFKGLICPFLHSLREGLSADAQSAAKTVRKDTVCGKGRSEIEKPVHPKHGHNAHAYLTCN